MITLSGAEKDLRAYLIDQARDDTDCLRSYGQIAEATDAKRNLDDPHHSRLKKRLFRISSYEVEHGRPMLSAIVVHSGDYRPGDGLYELARQLNRLKGEEDNLVWWNAEVERITRYWVTHSDDATKDAQFDAVMAELATVQQMIRTLWRG